MANTWTDYGTEQLLEKVFRGGAAATAARVVLIDTMPVVGTIRAFENYDATWQSTHEIATVGTDYVRGTGQTITLNSTGFDVLQDTTATGTTRTDLQLADVVFPTTAGNTITASGAALILTDGGTEKVYAVFDFQGDVTVSNGGSLTLQDCEVQIANA